MNTQSENGNLNKRIGIPLIIWGLISIIAGIFYLVSPSEVIKGVLLQAFFWGLIDGIIGLIPLLIKKVFVLEKIKKIFLVNVYLDIIYIIIGAFLIILGNNAFLMGNGIGVSIQGLFLFIVDLIHHNHIKGLIT